MLTQYLCVLMKWLRGPYLAPRPQFGDTWYRPTVINSLKRPHERPEAATNCRDVTQ